MSSLVRKEIRLLLPFFAIALLLAALPAWWMISEMSFTSPGGEAVFWIFGFGLVLLGLAPFGQEFGLGTFSSLLAQPAQRNRIWKTKLLLTLPLAVLVLLVLIISVHLRLESLLQAVNQRLAENEGYRVWDLNLQKSLVEELNSHRFWWIGLAAGAVGLTGGLWATLLFRQISAALWFALLVPAVFFVGAEFVVPDNSAREVIFIAAAAAYSVAGLFWAHRLFLQAQDLQWLGDAISPLGLRSASSEALGVRRRRPLRALVAKEIQSHQITFLIAFGLLVLHVCTLALRRFYTLPGNSQLRFAFESVPFLWFLLPWLIGSVAIAEERKLGTVECQFTMPVSRLFQFVIKFAVVLLLATVLGGLMPCLMEAIGVSFGVPTGVSEAHFMFSNPNVLFDFARGSIAVALALAVISFFASALTRNTLHALGTSIVFSGAFWILLAFIEGQYQRGYGSSLWTGSLIFVIGIPVAAAALLYLTWSNYKLLHIGGAVWLRTVAVLGTSLFLAGIATAAIYQRPWELLMSLEPKHGPTRLVGSVRPAVCIASGRVFALLPDGRLWAGTDYQWEQLDRYEEDWDRLRSKTQLRRVEKQVPHAGTFVGGSNWVQVAAAPGEVAALQADGSLWRITSWRDNTNTFHWKYWMSLTPEPKRIGSDSTWQSVVAASDTFVGLKTDGTLWAWGDIHLRDGSYVYDGKPTRIGTNSDWAAVFSKRDNFLFMKNNGDIWTATFLVLTATKIEGQDRFEPSRSNLNGLDWLQVSGGGMSSFYLHKDGTLWASGNLPNVVFGAHTRSWTAREPHRIGRDSDWQQISGEYWNVAAIKKGRIVESNKQLFSATLGQPSRNSDWLAIDAGGSDLVALAADGTLSYWYPRDEYATLLGPTRRPLWNLNVLGDTK